MQMQLKQLQAAIEALIRMGVDGGCEIREDHGQILLGPGDLDFAKRCGRQGFGPTAKQQAELRALGLKPDCCGYWGWDTREDY